MRGIMFGFGTLGQAVIKITGDASGFEKDAEKSGSSIGEKIAVGLRTALKVGVGAAVAGVGVVIGKGFARLNSLDQAQAKMRGLGYEGQELEGIMKSALKSVDGTAYGLGDAAQSAAMALNAGIEPGEQLDRTLKAVVGSAAASGEAMVELQGIFNKAATSGVDNEVLGQLARRGIPIIKQLAEDLGVTQDQIYGMARAGEISFDQLIESAENASGSIAEEMGKTLQGRLANAWASIGRIGANLLEGVFDKIGPGIGEITEWLKTLEPYAAQIGEWIGTSVEKAFSFIKDTVIPALQSMWEWITDNKETVAAFVGVIGGFIVINKVIGWVKAARAAVLAFNAALAANPIGLIVLAIAALVAGLVWLYNNNETARKIIDAAWQAIKTAISAVVDWAVNTAWPWLKDVFTKIGEIVQTLWNDWIKPAWEGIKTAISAVVDWLRNTAWPFVKGVFDKIGKAVEFLYVNFIRPQWILISKAIETVVNWLRNTAWPFIKKVFDWIGEAAKWLYEKAIKPAWEGIKKGIEVVVNWLRDKAWPIIKNAWDWIADGAKKMWEDWIKPAFDKFKAGIDVVAEAVGKAKDAISDTWSKITAAITGPLDAAKTFINDKFISPLNKMFETLKMTLRIPLISVGSSTSAARTGGPMLAMASGGTVPGFSPHPRADNIPIWATAGEYILPVNSTKRLMSQVGEKGMEMLRRGIIPGYALGGLVDKGVAWVKERGTDIIDLASKAWDVISDPVGSLRNFANQALAGIGESPFAQAMAAGARRIIDTVVEKIKEWVGAAGSGNQGGNNMGWQAMKAWFEATFPGQRITSGYRQGAVSITGIVSDHALGRAIDMPPSMAIFNKIDSTWGNIRQLLYSPAGPRQIRGGRRSDTIGSPLRAQHWDHVHWSMADGGWVSPFKPFVADRGALLAPGINVLDNRTGKPEPLARTDVAQRLHPDDIRALAEATAQAVERGAYRGVSEIGRGLALSGGRY